MGLNGSVQTLIDLHIKSLMIRRCVYSNLCLSMRKYVRSHVVLQSAGAHVWHSLILSDKGLVSLTLASTQYSTAQHIHLLVKDEMLVCMVQISVMTSPLSTRRTGNLGVVNHYLIGSYHPKLLLPRFHKAHSDWRRARLTVQMSDMSVWRSFNWMFSFLWRQIWCLWAITHAHE